MNINEIDLNLEENKKKISALILQLKTKLQEEETKRKEFEEKCYILNQQKLQLDQKLAKTELALKRKSEDLLDREEKAIEMQKKLDTLLNLHQKKKGLFSFGNDESKQLKQEILYIKSENEIKEGELQRLHELLFETKKQFEEQEDELKQQITNLEQSINQQIQLTESEKKQKQDLELIIQNQRQTIVERDQQLKDSKLRLNELDDEIRSQKDQIQLQQSQYNEIQNTLIHKKEELKRIYLETDQLKITMQQIKDTVQNTIPQLESEVSNSQVLLGFKQFTDRIFGVDKLRDTKVNQIKLEQELQKELLVQKDSYQVFQKAKERILKMGRNIEQLEKKNKQLQDRIYLLENKRTQGKCDLLSDKISVI